MGNSYLLLRVPFYSAATEGLVKETKPVFLADKKKLQNYIEKLGAIRTPKSLADLKEIMNYSHGTFLDAVHVHQIKKGDESLPLEEMLKRASYVGNVEEVYKSLTDNKPLKKIHDSITARDRKVTPPDGQKLRSMVFAVK